MKKEGKALRMFAAISGKNAKSYQERHKKILERLFESSPTGIILMQGRIMERVNPALCRMVGYTRHELEGRDPAMLYQSEEECIWEGAAAASDMRHHITTDCKAIWRCGDGRLLDVFLQSCPLDPGRPHLGHIVHVVDITEQRMARERMERYRAQVRRLAWMVFRAEERERRRLAEALHDGLSQSLALIRIGLKSLPAAGPLKRKSALKTLVDLVDNAFRQARELTSDLSPHILREKGLEAGLAWLADQTFKRHGIRTRFFSGGAVYGLDKEMAGVLYRAARELVVNAVKHGRPGSIDIAFFFNEARGIEITVKDDGRGFDVSKLSAGAPGGYGLFSIKERVEGLGGVFKIGSQPGTGTLATIEMPLSTCAADGKKQ